MKVTGVEMHLSVLIANEFIKPESMRAWEKIHFHLFKLKEKYLDYHLISILNTRFLFRIVLFIICKTRGLIIRVFLSLRL